MKLKLSLLFSLTLLLFSSCIKDKGYDDLKPEIIYEMKCLNQNLVAEISYYDQEGKLINATVDVPFKIAVPGYAEKDKYGFQGYLQTKDGSPYSGDIMFSTTITVTYPGGFFSAPGGKSYSVKGLNGASQELLRTETAFECIWDTKKPIEQN